MAGENNLNIIKQTSIDRSKEIIARTTAMSFQELQQQAVLFLTDVLNIYHSGNTVRRHSGGNDEIMRLWTIYRDAKTSQALALAQNSFALALDNYLKRTIILTYVSKDGRILLYTEEGEIEILNQVGKNAGRANFKQGAWEGSAKGSKMPVQYDEFSPGKEGELAAKIAASAAKRSGIYAEGIRRYDENQKYWNKTGNKKRPERENKLRRYYYDDTAKITHPETGFSKGEMAEAYVNAVVDNSTMLGDVNTGLRQLYSNYIAGNKDNIGAIVKGDVVLKDNGQITLAVKGQSASTAKIGQYIVAADQIRKMQAPPEEGIQAWLESIPKIGDYAKAVEADAKKEAEKVAFEQILKMSLS